MHVCWCESGSIHRRGSGPSPCDIFTCRAECELHHWPCSPRCRRRSYQSQFPFPGHPSWWYELVTYWWPSLQHRQDGAVEQTKTLKQKLSREMTVLVPSTAADLFPLTFTVWCLVYGIFRRNVRRLVIIYLAKGLPFSFNANFWYIFFKMKDIEQVEIIEIIEPRLWLVAQTFGVYSCLFCMMRHT